MPIHAVVFDLGGVVLGSPLHAIAAYERENGISENFVNRVVADEELAKATNEWATLLASGATSAFGVTKKLVLGSLGESFEAQMELESRAIAASGRTEDAKEGIAAFLAKRKADFPGR